MTEMTLDPTQDWEALYNMREWLDAAIRAKGGRICWPTYEQAAEFARRMVTIEDVPPSGYTALKRKCDMQKEMVHGLKHCTTAGWLDKP